MALWVFSLFLKAPKGIRGGCGIVRMFLCRTQQIIAQLQCFLLLQQGQQRGFLSEVYLVRVFFRCMCIEQKWPNNLSLHVCSLLSLLILYRKGNSNILVTISTTLFYNTSNIIFLQILQGDSLFSSFLIFSFFLFFSFKTAGCITCWFLLLCLWISNCCGTFCNFETWN